MTVNTTCPRWVLEMVVSYLYASRPTKDSLITEMKRSIKASRQWKEVSCMLCLSKQDFLILRSDIKTMKIYLDKVIARFHEILPAQDD